MLSCSVSLFLDNGVQNIKSVTIIGTGAVGTALHDFFKKERIEIRSAWGSNSGNILTDSGEYLKVDTNLPVNDGQTGTFVFITTSDDLIREISDQLASANIDWKIRNVIHCSGNLTSDELSSLARAGAGTASMHPIQTFKKGDNAERFREITISLEGNARLTIELEEFITQMGARSLHLSKEQKRTVHIAAVFASNYMVSLMHSAADYLEKEGISEGIEILKPLILQTVQNIIEKGVTEALTGPVSRGDIASIRKHIDSLKTNDDMLTMYQILGKQAVGITRKRREIPDDIIREMMALFSV